MTNEKAAANFNSKPHLEMRWVRTAEGLRCSWIKVDDNSRDAAIAAIGKAA